MTELEYVIARYLGPPTVSLGNGRSEWPCPHCGHGRFHTMPEKPEFKHRFRCWKCDFRGDVFDFLQEQHPDESFGDRLDRLDQLRRDCGGDGPSDFFFRGDGEYVTQGVVLLRRLLAANRIDHDDLLEVAADLNVQLELRREAVRLGRKRKVNGCNGGRKYSKGRGKGRGNTTTPPPPTAPRRPSLNRLRATRNSLP